MRKVNLQTMRHSCSHVLAAAIKSLYPDTKFAIGPDIENGFYYDFEFSQPFSKDELSKISSVMNEIISRHQSFLKKRVKIDAAKELFTDQPYKKELLADLKKEGQKSVTIYYLGDPAKDKNCFYDLCLGPHVKNSGLIGPYKLTSVAGAYWRGDEKKPMMTRIYGTCFASKKQLDKYLSLLEEAGERDHRKLGKKLDLFLFDDDIGQGLPLFTPKGAILRNEIINFAFNTYLSRGYQPVSTPHIASIKLWKKSGHWNFYRDSMYSPFGIENEKYTLKPMNCPLQVKIYKAKTRSYRDLPLRWTEMGTVYRYEKSGVLQGLLRVRGFTQDDAHIICTPEQLSQELVEVIDLIEYLLQSFGFSRFRFELSVRDPKNQSKYLGDNQMWEFAEKALANALKTKGYHHFERIEGEAVFYGPKIDLKMDDSLGRQWQLSTLQVDFNLPQRFEMDYVGPDGHRHRPILLHRALLGSIERFIAILIEHYAGAFPTWLSPVQVMVIPINSDYLKQAQSINQLLKSVNIRSQVDDRQATTGAKIRDAEVNKIPYMLFYGGKEMKKSRKNTPFISVRVRGEKELGLMPLKQFLERINLEIANKAKIC